MTPAHTYNATLYQPPPNRTSPHFLLPEELAKLKNYYPKELHPYWRTIKPHILRHFIYRGICGAGGWEQIVESRVAQHELLVLAELTPTCWGLWHSMEDYKYLWSEGVCLACHTLLEFPAGARLPLVSYCLHCNSKSQVLDALKLPFWQTIQHWPMAYVQELLGYFQYRREHEYPTVPETQERPYNVFQKIQAYPTPVVSPRA